MKDFDRYAAWPARVLWVFVAVAASIPLADAIDGRSTAIRWLVVVGCWTAWTVAAVCLLVPRHVFLTGARILVPAGLAVTLAAVACGSSLDAADVSAVLVTSLCTAWVLTPWFGEMWVDGSSYGPEKRLPLRPPTTFSLVVVPVTWVAVVAGATAGPLLLAASKWLPGALLTAVGFGVAYAGTRALHQLSRRWVVMVPAGMVLHDSLTMPEPQLFLRHTVRRLGPAPADVDDSAEDLTAGAAGLALRLELDEPVELLVRRGGRRTETVERTVVLFTPSRPHRLLETASKRRIPIG
ncbi:MAG: hypothetical protein KDB02_06050 [Acidimicrobiales bacterium]|nr:hypothetical protein [Acidimicrobiales bacterium]